MDITVNGSPLEAGRATEGTVGEALARVDEILERSGSIIVGIRLDGRDIDAEAYPGIRDLPAAGAGLAEIAAEGSAGVRARTIGALVGLLELAGDAATSGSDDWAGIGRNAADVADAFGGLFPADELAYVQGFAALVADAAAGPAAPSPALSAEIARQAGRLGILFRERLAELEDPAGEMARAAAAYAEHAGELRELPVYLQTGKEERAMKAVLVFIEIFNKVIRLMPELARRGLDSSAIRVDGLGLPAFYASFNEILRRLSRALEDKDSVLIGDLAEYEVEPRMASLFRAVSGAMAPS